jgi:cation:H+ antiporter
MISSIKKGILLAMASTQQTAAAAGWGSALWTFPSVLLSAMLIAWGAEAAQFLISQGLALAILAWLQTLPEFAVEAVIAFEASKDASKIHLVTANFTGSLRLLTGLGWPMIYGTAALFHRRKYKKPIGEIKIEDEHSIEVVGLVIPILYFVYIYFKGTLSLYDTAVLTFIYAAYLWILRKIPPQGEEGIEEMELIPRTILSFSKPVRNAIIISLFVGGGLILYFVAHPFLESMLAVAVSMGISQFVFVQWVSPFLSEFPEKVSAFHWARQVKSAPMALMNMVSSNINQWTMLVAMIPVVYCYGLGDPSAVIQFDHHQREEILLTLAQAFVGFMFLLNMSFSWYEALGLFVLWLIQFLQPHLRLQITYVYFAWFGVEIIRAAMTSPKLPALREFARLFRIHVLKQNT